MTGSKSGLQKPVTLFAIHWFSSSEHICTAPKKCIDMQVNSHFYAPFLSEAHSKPPT